jgi:fatty-acyl-CoA synthase
MVLGNLVTLNYGGTIIYANEGFDAISSLEAITKYKATVVYGVPTMFIAMLDERSKHRDKFDVSSLRTGIISGAGTPESLMKKVV